MFLFKKINNLSIMFKVQLISLGFVFISSVIIGVIVDARTTANTSRIAQQTLSSIADQRIDTLELYLDNLERNVLTLAEQTPSFIEASEQLLKVAEEEGFGFRNQIRRDFIDRNPYKKQERNQLITPPTESEYNNIHSRHHLALRKFAENYFTDLYIIDNDGLVVYSINKFDDFGRNVSDSQLKDTGLARAYNNAKKQVFEKNKMVFEDFSFYPPFNNKPAAFYGITIVDELFEPVGTLVVSLDSEGMKNIISSVSGLSEQTEVFIVNKDYFFLTAPKFSTGEDVIFNQIHR